MFQSLKDGEWEWEVDRIEGMRTDRRGVTKFLVFWLGYPRPEWKPLEELKHCKESIRDYLARSDEEIPVQKFRNFLMRMTDPLCCFSFLFDLLFCWVQGLTYL